MEDWQLDFEWLRIRHFVKDTLGRDELPDMNAMLFLVGIQELGYWPESFTKEQKQDLMHIAVCRLLSSRGYFEFEGLDDEGWPHWKLVKPIDALSKDAQENLLKEMIIKYFENYTKTEPTNEQTSV